MLLSGSGNPAHFAEIEPAVFHACQDQVQSFDPHGHRRINLVLFFILVDAALNLVVREVGIEIDGFFMDRFQVGGDGKT